MKNYSKPKLIRTATVAISLDILLKGQLSFLNSHYEVVAVSGADGHLETVAEREGVRVVSVPMSRSIAPIKDLVSLVKMYFLFKKEKPQIVHSITPKAGLLSMTAAYFAGVPVRMHTFTGLIFPYKKGLMQTLLLFMDKVLCRFATHIFPEGEGVKSDLQRYKVTTKPLHVLANGNVNGIDTAYFDQNQVSESEQLTLRKELQLNLSDFVFVFVGRLVADKGVNELVAAFSELSKTNTHCKLLLVGPLESELDPLSAATLQAISNNRSIISVGFQADIRSYLSISNVFVFPSYREGFPNVVLQAGAMGLPCIVTNISGSNEIIQDNSNGIVIPVRDTQSLLTQMDLLLQDNVLTNNLAQSAREIIVTRYKQQMVWEAVLDTYKKYNT
jgi:glycosyltransferase involved in cell wall biosynthesis